MYGHRENGRQLLAVGKPEKRAQTQKNRVNPVQEEQTAVQVGEHVINTATQCVCVCLSLTRGVLI